jgi:hypothetical protein
MKKWGLKRNMSRLISLTMMYHLTGWNWQEQRIYPGVMVVNIWAYVKGPGKYMLINVNMNSIKRDPFFWIRALKRIRQVL